MYDAIVIGSGIGGMTAAGLLARVAGKRVLVLEKHSTPGGQTHVFRRDGASWDVGLHYVGSLDHGTPLRNYFDFLSGGRLHWNRMPERFDRFVCPGLDFSIPSDETRYRQELIERFPDEAPAIQRYFRDIHRRVRWLTLGYMRAMVPAPVVPVLRLLQRVLGRKTPLLTTGAYLDQHFKSPQLKSLLASQWGDYGMPPDRGAFAIHAMIVTHFLGGAWFPEGGSGRIARSFETGIEAAGGAIRVSQEVTRILTENGRAVGIEARDWRLPGGPLRIHRAPIIISDIGARSTYEQLLPTDGPIGVRTHAVRALINEVGHGCSAVSLYLRLKDSIRSLGIEGENIWVNAGTEHPSLDVNGRAVLDGKPCGIFVSFPSIKGGDEKFHTAEIISFIDIDAFVRWQHQAKGQRDADYLAIKTQIIDGLLQRAESAIPGLRSLIIHTELGTPLSVVDYTSHPKGCFYGLPATPARLHPSLMTPKTPVPGLLLAGQDVTCCGIAGALMGGVSAACAVLGSRGYPKIQTAIRKMRQQNVGQKTLTTLPEGKHPVCLDFKKQLTNEVWLLRFSLVVDPHTKHTPGASANNVIANSPGSPSMQPVRPSSASELTDTSSASTRNSESRAHAASAPPLFTPGQFARIQVAPLEWRDYSIVSCTDRQIEFLISTHTGGEGSRFVRQIQPGDRTRIELPLGQFLLHAEGGHPVFVATGTGIAPFLPMFSQLDTQNRLAEATLLFGCRTADDDLSLLIGSRPLPGHIIRCYSRAEAPPGGIHGRVTQALEQLFHDQHTASDSGKIGNQSEISGVHSDISDTREMPPSDITPTKAPGGIEAVFSSSRLDLTTSRFHLCGHPAMIQEASALLRAHGAAHVHMESY